MTSVIQAEDGSFPLGSPLSLRLDGKNTLTTFRILRNFTPFTRGQVYLVRPESHEDFPSPLILKVYDPKFRSDRFLPRRSRPWLLSVETIAVVLREHGVITHDFHPLDIDIMFPWHWEANFINNSELSFKQEVLAYKNLVELQGRFIPKFYASGRLPPSESRTIEPGALLIEYIPGVTLHDIDPALVLPELYQPLIEAVATFHKHGVIHYDINGHNIMFVPPEAPERAVIIDFGETCTRLEDESDEEWDSIPQADVAHLRMSLENRLGTRLDVLALMRKHQGARWLCLLESEGE